MAKAGSGGHGVGVTRNRAIRVSDELWEAAQRKAQERDERLSDVIRTALVLYVGDRALKGLDSDQ